MNSQTKTYNLLPQQLEFINSTQKEVLQSSGWGGAKSTALCFAILKEACTPNAQILLCRKTYTSLRRTTLQTLLFGSNPIIPLGSYNYNKVNQTITLNGINSVIYLSGLDSMEKIRSMNLSFIAVDEASELEESEWIELMGRLRDLNGSRRIVGATNPSSPSHWLYRRFFLEDKPDRKVIRANTLNNPYLPKDYVESLKDMPEQLYNRFVLGEWLAMENMIYVQFNREQHVKTRGMGEFKSYLLGVDWGFSPNPTAILFFGLDGDNNLHLIEERKVNKLVNSRIVSMCDKYLKFEPVVIVDPSAPSLISEFEQEGFNTQKADNAVDAGISRVQDYLHKGKLTIDPQCTEFVKELEGYIYNKDGKPIKINDHMMDACRYVVSSVAVEPKSKAFAFVIDNEEDYEN